MIKKVKVKDIVSEIDALDREAYPEENTDFDGINWYLNRYDGRETVYAYYSNDELVAYLTVALITKDFVDAILAGVLNGDMSVDNAMFRGKYPYFNSIVVKNNFRCQGIAHELFDACMKDFSGQFMCALANEHSKKAFEHYGFVEGVKTEHYTVMYI